MDASYAVQLIVPAEPGSARLARLVAAALAADADFSVDDTEDLRVAVSELVALLVEGAVDPGGQVTLDFNRLPSSVEVTGTRVLHDDAPATVDGAHPDDLALEILRVVVDEHTFDADASGRHFRLVKRARADV
jgi:Histidine kinase-like ATPase domain